MSVEQTLAERGERYGDFTDHAAICQRIKMAMIAGKARWARLSDVQKQALEVIADKIARILSGDPNYADNWHDIQGYAKLVEDRLPKPMEGVRQEGETIIMSTPEQRDAVYAALGDVVDPGYGKVSIHIGAQPKCPECGYPTDAAGTHYVTCSKLTAPKEFVDQVEQTFDELESNVSGQCPECGAALGTRHEPHCTEYAALPVVEPAAAIDDESPRAQAIGQNGNDGAAYEDPFYGAPEWAKWKAQDKNGAWYWFEVHPHHESECWMEPSPAGSVLFADRGDPNPNWRDTLTQRP